ncbi:pentatricopeptide repeat-containing protein At3g26630, chloroplastic-like [Carica papaya]|uniref:pentatricopeptide repeat-containing protein At3g26630, chloroplastic-like n=1 Tax=Carica papaya TaxID=3649 RepID=UPI000B8CC12F|nr:pentatricopeptide repeat-containing protein At3g26630, chloroplastic-like [Carica papaya]
MASLHLQANPPLLNPPKTQYTPYQGLQTCSTMAELRQHHSQIIKLGLSVDNDAIGRVIKFCAISENGDLGYALQVFTTIPHPDAFIYNTIMKGHLQAQLSANCILLYLQMLQELTTPNRFTFPTLIRACSVRNSVEEGKQVHAHVFKFGHGVDGCSQNNLIHMYVNFQSLEEARRVFDKMPTRDVVSWTSLITGYSQWGSIDEAFEIFEVMPERNSVSWNAMIAACAQSNRFCEASGLFDRMRAEKVALDKFVAASMLSACTGLGSLEQGKWIHEYIEKSGIEMDAKLGTTVIDMYCKCGCLEKAFQVFNGLGDKGISAWNCMIGGLAIHGKGKDAIELFKKMERETVAPDHITFVNLLSACAHSGLVDEGRYYFRYMVQVHGIETRMEHYGCMVDLLGTGGRGHPEAKQIYGKVDEMLERIRCFGYVPDTDLDEEEDRYNPSYYHSEKLAIAFGLLKTKPGETIRIFKNLRVCKDCHNATKLISKHDETYTVD